MTANLNPKVLLIIPAFNERENIGPLLLSLREHGYEALVVNDGSTDDTASICSAIGASVVSLPCNLGIGGAVQTGYKYAYAHGYDIAIQFDGDGQHRAEFIPALIAPLLAGEADLAIGSRYIEKEGFQSTFLRRAGIRYFSRLIRLITGQTVTDPTSGFRAVNRSIMAMFTAHYPTDYPEPESIVHVLRLGGRVAEVPVLMSERAGGRSSIRSLRSVYYMIKVSLAILIDSLRGSGVHRT
ncbi:glycosyltransferase family 2 protein [Saccharibacillus alkalitolerans]|uniref:Glycosyltransferase family 2 protein n=1 Tax=Saccharibacillus alkalitolerans TaxID=2705290 RepID=A0ABX0FA11_9BACL|nr:glycosyltransferase family 2 protein [Saccharibacillus alkalitolerans]NGZ76046.1 glycosyltransferase family 2 protein [Saccharibacillus alkalitolerans]